ncbi:MAG: hypothetical protein P8N76_12925 [Pirellulaceae bacterium]|nr:hypothetical protein [Pirellulaceae bacterium]
MNQATIQDLHQLSWTQNQPPHPTACKDWAVYNVPHPKTSKTNSGSPATRPHSEASATYYFNDKT